ncbi:MAG: DUF6515 family protein [Longimicrobiales bacterium]
MSREQANVRRRAGVALVSAALLGLTSVPELRADRPGSVRHSSSSKKKPKKSTSTRATTPNRRPAGKPASTRSSARAGYRAGYRHGSYHGRHDARRTWRRWRAVTGLIRLGVYSATRPKQSTTVVVTGTTYYYSGGVYYVQSGSGYTVVSAPPGAVVHAVPTYTTVVYVGTTPYYYSGGAYYVATDAPAPQPPPEDASGADEPVAADDPSQIPMIEDDHNYQVVAPPAGATVSYLPDEADEETINGKKYFVYADTYYRPFASDGETIYMVVEDPRQT